MDFPYKKPLGHWQLHRIFSIAFSTCEVALEVQHLWEKRGHLKKAQQNWGDLRSQMLWIEHIWHHVWHVWMFYVEFSGIHINWLDLTYLNIKFYVGSQSQVRMEQHKIRVEQEQHEAHNWTTVKSANLTKPNGNSIRIPNSERIRPIFAWRFSIVCRWFTRICMWKT